MHRLFWVVCTAIFGIITGSILKKCILRSLIKRGYREPVRLYMIPAANAFLYVWMIAGAGWKAEGLPESLLGCLCVSALLAVGIIDGKTLEIPWKYNLFIGGLGILEVLLCLSRWFEHFAGFFAVSGLLLLFFIITGGKSIGGGDVKLMAAAGLFLGWEKAMLAFCLGGIAGAGFQLLFKRKGQKGKVFALGPYLAAGIIVVMLGEC